VGALSFYALLWVPLLACLIIVHRYTPDGSTLEWGRVCSTFLGILSLGTLYIALGVFASALTRNQIIAATVALAMGVSLFLLSFAAPALTERAALPKPLLRDFS